MNSLNHHKPPNLEFVILMASMMSLVALSIDAILPAMGLISSSLSLTQTQNIQLVISLVLLGQGLGQLVWGPLSDTFGRKPLIYAGYSIFIMATILCMYTTTFDELLIGRFMQGFGVAAPRVLTMVMIRDKYSGKRMAQVMSFIMVFFILVPMIAPLLGQGILLFAPWRAIFAAMLIFGLISLIWFALRQPETLANEHKKELKLSVLFNTFKEVITTPISMCYTLASGVLSGSFIAYLASAQQLFGQVYGLTSHFAIYFSSMALVFGLASFFNGKIVVKKGMQYLVYRAFSLLVFCSMIFLFIVLTHNDLPPFSWTTIYFVIVFSCVGVLFGNLNSLAMEPLGHLAGFGAAIVGAFSTLIAVSIAMFISDMYNGTVLPLTIGFTCCSLVSGLVVFSIERYRHTQKE